MYLLFDGGNGGHKVNKGYGSFIIKPNKNSAEIIHHERIEFIQPMTNNEAEYNTLIYALQWINDTIDDPVSLYGGMLYIEGDSELVRNQVMGYWQVKELRMKPLRDKVQQLLKALPFLCYTYNHVSRAYVVSILGH